MDSLLGIAFAVGFLIVIFVAAKLGDHAGVLGAAVLTQQRAQSVPDLAGV